MNAPLHVAINEKRSSARIVAAYPVRFRGVGLDGQIFKEETVLDNLSGGGSYLRLKRAPSEGSNVSLAARLSTTLSGEVPALRLAASGIVLRVEPQPDGRYGVAIEFKRRRVL